MREKKKYKNDNRKLNSSPSANACDMYCQMPISQSFSFFKKKGDHFDVCLIQVCELTFNFHPAKAIATFTHYSRN